MNRIHFLFLVLMFFLAPVLAQLPGYTTIENPGTYLLRLDAKQNARVKCEIRILKYSRDDKQKGWWGVDVTSGVPARSVVAGITFWVGKAKIQAPMSSYADLANLDYAKLVQRGQTYSLQIMGGDGITGYNVNIDFNNTVVTSRAVHWGSDSADWEETTYHVDTSTTDY